MMVIYEQKLKILIRGKIITLFKQTSLKTTDYKNLLCFQNLEQKGVFAFVLQTVLEMRCCGWWKDVGGTLN